MTKKIVPDFSDISLALSNSYSPSGRPDLAGNLAGYDIASASAAAKKSVIDFHACARRSAFHGSLGQVREQLE